jgi:hypothetical protein
MQGMEKLDEKELWRDDMKYWGAMLMDERMG